MNIAINTLGPSKVKAGVGNYVCHVVHQLALLDKVNTYYIIINKDNMHQFNDLPQHFRTIRAPTLTTNKTLRILWEQIAIPYLCHTHNIDVLHSPGFVAPLFLPCRSVVTIHDMTFFTHPDVHEQSKIAYFKLMIPPTVRKADIVIADSHATHKDICSLINVPERKVRTIPLAAEMKQINVGEARDFLRDTYDITNPFILFVGMIEPRKNVKGIIEAYSRLHTSHLLV
ncbi:glycosyltransferase, partial [Candidatus Woesearchaeota archaeon]|nr:glycosyltransferase [Candidatus Woesearchaeota archaeon]